MGADSSKGLSRHVEAQNKNSNAKVIPEEYKPCFEAYKANPNFLNELLIENPRFTANIQKLFPNISKSYEDFTQMILFLIKSEIKEGKSQFIKHNARQTSLLQRFFMVALEIPKWEDLDKTKLDDNQLQDAFIEFMKLFIPNPEKGFIKKLKKWVLLEGQESLSIKQFCRSLKDVLPLVNKNIRNYVTKKFRDLTKEGHLLKNFDSAILKQDAVLLCLRLNELSGKQIKLLYSSDTNGLSFHSYEKRVIGYDGPFLLLIENYDDKVTYKFGTYQVGPIRDLVEHQGDLRGFMFSIEPNIRFMTTDKGEQASNYYFINTIDEKISKRRKGIGFGGDKHKDNCKLWIDQDLDKSTVFNGPDPTYGYGPLANPMSTQLSIKRMEIWGLGSNADLQNQALYWEDREQEALKRRKVNKKQLVNGMAGLMFEKTFAHRDQVVGDIEKKNEE